MQVRLFEETFNQFFAMPAKISLNLNSKTNWSNLMLGISLAQFKKAILLSLVWLAFLSFYAQKPNLALRPDLHDHISNLHATVLFWHKGFQIYLKPTQSLVQRDTSQLAEDISKKWNWPKHELFRLADRRNLMPMMMVWEGMPRPYPPGLYVLLTPLALAMEATGGFSESILFLLVLFFCLAGHLVFFQLVNVIAREPKSVLGSFFFKLAMASIYFDLIGWSLSGQYEALGLIFLIPSLVDLNNKRYLRSFILFCISSFIHFRILLWSMAPLLIWASHAKTLYREFYHLRRWEKCGALVCGGLGLTSGVVFLTIYRSLLEVPETNFFTRDLLAGNWSLQQLIFVIGLGLIGAYFYRIRNWFYLLALVNILILFMSAEFLRTWYVLYLFPLLFAFRSETEPMSGFWMRYSSLVLVSYSYLISSPTEFYFLKKALELLL